VAKDAVFLYPHITQIPDQVKDDGAASGARGGKKNEPTDFDLALSCALKEGLTGELSPRPAGQMRFSAHAAQRLRDRKIQLDPETMGRVNDAMTKALSKGVEDALIMTEKAALIVNAKSRTVITVMDLAGLKGNVFTNIDGAVIV
jgi:flagellar operon protein